MTGVKRRKYVCPTCGRKVSTSERVDNADDTSTYLPRPGQYRSRMK